MDSWNDRSFLKRNFYNSFIKLMATTLFSKSSRSNSESKKALESNKNPESNKIIRAYIDISKNRGNHPVEYQVSFLHRNDSITMEWLTTNQIYEKCFRENIPFNMEFKRKYISHVRKELQMNSDSPMNSYSNYNSCSNYHNSYNSFTQNSQKIEQQ